MTESDIQADGPADRGVDRRTLLKATAWSAPVIVLAAAAPAAMASVTQPACTAVPAPEWTNSGVLYHDGARGFAAGTTLLGFPWIEGLNWPVYTTGWTPKSETWPVPEPGHITVEYALAGRGIGFMSMDDNDNHDDANQASNTVTAGFSFPVEAGYLYSIVLPVDADSPQNGTQYVDITASGPGISTTIAQRYVGDKTISLVPEPAAAFAAHTVLSASQMITAAVTPTAAGTVTITYTFTLAYVFAGDRQNADIWIGQPLLTCTRQPE